MKYLLATLSAALLLMGCSGNEGAIVPADPPAEITEDVATEEETETSSEEESSDGDDADEKEAGVNQKNVKLVVKDQITVGQIVVETVATARDGWVSVHKSQENGGIVLPDSIGEARVDSGDSEEIIVDLWEAPEIGEKLWVLLHIDAGERGQYEFPGKDQAVQKNGETMARSFLVKDPNPDKDDEDSEDE